MPSTSFVTVVEMHNVDVPVASNRDATVLSPTVDTLQWPSAIVVNFEIQFDSFTYIVSVYYGNSFIHIHSQRVLWLQCHSHT